MQFFMHLVAITNSREEATNKAVILTEEEYELLSKKFEERFSLHQIFTEEILAKAEEIADKAVNFRA